MIIGLGNDMVDIRRIEKTLERYGQRFVERIYTDIEQKKSDSPRAAGRFLRETLCRQGGLLKSPGHWFSPGGFLEGHGRGE